MSESEVSEESVQLPELEVLCPECGGDTDYNGNPCGPWEPCGSCDGAGYLLTAFGEKVLRLVRRRLRI
jgi:hypothetical protein